MFKMTQLASIALVLSVPAVAQAKPPTQRHVKQYVHDYHAVRHQFGAKAAGCNLIERKGSCHHKATDAAVVKSLGVLGRTLAPPPRVSYSYYTVPNANSTAAMAGAAIASTSTPPPIQNAPVSSSLESCVIQHESGGNPQAVSPNGKYMGIGQWQESTWVADGGTRYAPTPLGASYQDQARVLSSEGSGGMEAQQGQYDGC